METKKASDQIDGEAVAAAVASTAPASAVVEASTSKGDDVDGDDGENGNGGGGQRSPWDQTSQKVVVRNVLKYIRHKELSKLADSWLVGREDLGIKILRTKKPPKDNWCKVTLADESMVGPFVELINRGGENGEAMTNARGKPLFAKRADDGEADWGGGGGGGGRKRRNRDGDDGDEKGDGKEGEGGGRNNSNNNNGNKKMRRDDKRPPIRVLSTEEVRDKITPLWRMTYEEQLESKAKEMAMKCAAKIVKEIRNKFKTLEREARRGQRKGTLKLYDWMQTKNAIAMDPPLPSPLKCEYRNKCEFTIGYRLVEKEADAEKDAEMKEGEAKGAEAEVAKETDAEAAKDAEMQDAETKEGEATAATSVPEKTEEEKFDRIPSAGFLAQGWSGGVYPPHPLRNMPDWSCGICDVLDEFLRTSPLPPYDSRAHRGVWRTVTLRASLRTEECMAIVLHAPPGGGAGKKEDGSDDRTAEFEGERDRLVGMLTAKEIPKPRRDVDPKEEEDGGEGEREGRRTREGLRVTSVFFQEFGGVSHPGPDHPVQHVFGKTSIEERLGKCTFQISPGAFFQTNTEGAEVLYDIVVERVREVTPNPERTLLLDVCCGTGTIGLTCLKEGVVGKLIGVDISEPAIHDAEANATKNGYRDDETTEFIASPAEKILGDRMKDVPRGDPIVAVVDPARDGLHGSVIKALRANEGIERLVYVSCNPTATLVRDAGMLCSPPTKKYPGRPFRPTRSQPVDMFPSTKHCEMVMTFDRMSEEEFERSRGGEAEKKAEEQTEKSAAEKTEESTAEKTEENTQVKTEDNTEVKTEDNTEVKTEDNTEVKTEK